MYTRILTLISKEANSLNSKLKMASTVPIKEQIVIEKSAVITFEHVVDEMAFRRYLKDHWMDLTLGLKSSAILFLAGVPSTQFSEFSKFFEFSIFLIFGVFW